MKKGLKKHMGYKADSPDRFNPVNVIPGRHITMKNVPHPVLGMDDMGNMRMMFPGMEYLFGGSKVMELPIRQTGGNTNYDTYQAAHNQYGANPNANPKVFTSSQFNRQMGMQDFELPAGATGATRYKVSDPSMMPGVPNFYSDPSGQYIYLPTFPAPVIPAQTVTAENGNTGATTTQPATTTDPNIQGYVRTVYYDPESNSNKVEMKPLFVGQPIPTDGTFTPVGGAVMRMGGNKNSNMKKCNFGGPIDMRQFQMMLMQQGGPTNVYDPKVNGNVEVVWDTPIYDDKFKNKSFHTNAGVGTGAFDSTGKEYSEAHFTFGDRLRNLFKPNQDRIVPSFQMGGNNGGYHMMQDGTWMRDSEMMNEGGHWIQDATASIKKRGTEGVCSGDKFGSESCPPGSKRYNLAQTFKAMAAARKKQMGGTSTAPQNFSTPEIISSKRNQMQNFLSQNALDAMALEEAQVFSDNFMQLGGFNPNLYPTEEYAYAADQYNNRMRKGLGDLFAGTYNAFATANPFIQAQVKTKQMGGNQFQYPPIDSAFVSQVEQDYQNYLRNKGQTTDLLDYVKTGQPIPTYLDLQNQNAVTAKGPQGGGGAKPSINSAGSANQTDVYTPSSTGNYTSSAGGSGTGQPTGAPVANNQGYPINQQTGPRQGNYVDPGQTNQNSGQPYYVQGQPVDQYGYPVYTPQQGQNVLFPMNYNPYVKFKGRGPMFAGLPAYNPENTYIQSIEEKGRILGPGIRKRTTTFTHGSPSGTPGQNTTPGYTAPNGQSTNTLDSYIESQMDPTLYSKMIEGDASPEEVAAFNEQYRILTDRYNQFRIGQPLSADVKVPAKTKFKNYMQELEAERNRRKTMKNPVVPSGVHPGFLNRPMQFGGGLNASDMTAFDASVRAGYRGNMGTGDENQSVLVEKFKMGWDPEAALNWGNAGANMFAGMLEAKDARKNQEIMAQRMNADALFQPIGFGSASRGDYEVNTGMFRPDQMVPTQFQGNNFGMVGSPMYKNGGGVYMLNDEQIAQVMKMGGTIEYLD